VTKAKRPVIPKGKPSPPPPIGVRELDRFSNASIDRWNALSKDLDELEAVMHFHLEPERRRLRGELIAALQKSTPKIITTLGWVRIVDYKFTLMPLSSAGSLTEFGGRFNAGADLDEGTLNPWPALYIAEDYETAFREKFQLKSIDQVDGLKPQELALEHGRSHTTVVLRGQIENVFDMSSPSQLNAIAAVLKKIKFPDQAKKLMKKLVMKSNDYAMVRSGASLYDAVLRHNWKIQPVQFGLPARSQVLAELVRAAGFEAILYKSTMGPAKCLAILPDKLSGASYLELADNAPPEVKITRLDTSSAQARAGWHILPAGFSA